MRQRLIVERDVESASLDEVAGARAGDGERRPLRGRVVNDDTGRVETILPPQFQAHAHRVRMSGRAGDEKAILSQAQRHSVVEHDTRFLQDKAVADPARLEC